jgi:hypothetical protein
MNSSIVRPASAMMALRVPFQLLVVGDSQPAMRLFLLSHDDVRTGLVIDFKPDSRESLDRLDA